jgi:hypothetical protein
MGSVPMTGQRNLCPPEFDSISVAALEAVGWDYRPAVCTSDPNSPRKRGHASQSELAQRAARHGNRGDHNGPERGSGCAHRQVILNTHYSGLPHA